MLFSSITFLFFFLPIVMAVYYIVPYILKNYVLLAASIFFYAWGEPVYVILMILSIMLNYFCGQDIADKLESPRKAKRSVVFAVVANLAILGFFKYYGFVVGSLNAVLPFDIPYKELPLPIGISFYTFQAISYILDVYRKDAKPQKNILYFALYISMFPQLIAGPIVRYVDVEEQLKKRSISLKKFGEGAVFFIIGLAKKAVLANTTGAVFEQIAARPAGELSVFTAWLGCISYAFQIYFDFGGYSDMAVGLGKMFGFEFKRNFDYPYISKSVTEFWRRWHISLGTWFREYLYIPLGGNRCAPPRHILNLLIVWSMTGLWHGAAWNFVAWGLYYGILLILEKYVWGRLIERLPHVIRHLYALVLILIGWVFFFSPTLGSALSYIGAMFGRGAGLSDAFGWFLLLGHWLLYALAVLGSTRAGITLLYGVISLSGKYKAETAVTAFAYIGMFLVSVAFLVTDTFNPFLYFRF